MTALMGAFTFLLFVCILAGGYLGGLVGAWIGVAAALVLTGAAIWILGD
jgi:hypothetical protein